ARFLARRHKMRGLERRGIWQKTKIHAVVDELCRPLVVEKMQGAEFSNHANAKYEAELKAVTKKHGFKNFAEYEAVAANISLVMAQIDPQTKVFMDPQTAIKKELEDVSADKTIPNNEKKKL